MEESSKEKLTVQWQKGGNWYFLEGATSDNHSGNGDAKGLLRGSEARLESGGRKCSGCCLHCCPHWLSLKVTAWLWCAVNPLGAENETSSMGQAQLLSGVSEDHQKLSGDSGDFRIPMAC